MSNHTPTTKDVRGDYIALSATYAGKPSSESGPEFDRWLTGEIRRAKTEARAEALAKAHQWLDHIAPNGLISKASVLADLEMWSRRATRGIQPNGNPYTEES